MISEDNVTVDDKYVDEYQSKLSENIADGAGCTEVWNALSEERSSNDQPAYTRRKLVGAIGLAALGFGGISGSSTAQQVSKTTESDDQPKFDIIKVTDKEKRTQIRQQAFSNTTVRKIREKFRSNRWQAQEDNVLINKTVAENGEVKQYTLTLPFATDQSRSSAGITWTDNPELEIKGVHSINYDSKITFTRYTVVDGEIVTSQNTVTREDLQEAASSENDVVAMGGFPNCNWNHNCISQIAIAAGGTIGCCGTCASVIGAAGSGGTSCICCVLAAIGTVTINCDLCLNMCPASTTSCS